MNKKANLDDVPFAMKLIFSLVFFIMFTLVFFTEANDSMQNNGNLTNTSKEFLNTAETQMINGWDYVFIILMIGWIAFSVYQARSIPTNRFFMALAVIFIIFTWLGSIAVAHFWVEMLRTNAMIQNMADNLRFIPWIMPNMLYYALVYTLAVGIALWTKNE